MKSTGTLDRDLSCVPLGASDTLAGGVTVFLYG